MFSILQKYSMKLLVTSFEKYAEVKYTFNTTFAVGPVRKY